MLLNFFSCAEYIWEAVLWGPCNPWTATRWSRAAVSVFQAACWSSPVRIFLFLSLIWILTSFLERKFLPVSCRPSSGPLSSPPLWNVSGGIWRKCCRCFDLLCSPLSPDEPQLVPKQRFFSFSLYFSLYLIQVSMLWLKSTIQILVATCAQKPFTAVHTRICFLEPGSEWKQATIVWLQPFTRCMTSWVWVSVWE